MQKLIELSPDQLFKTTVGAFPNTKARQHLTPYVLIVNLTITPYVKNRGLAIHARANSNGHIYQVGTEVMGATVARFDEHNNSIPNGVVFTASDNQKYSIVPFDPRQVQAQVRCNCLDFYMRFAPYNERANSLFGDPFPYYRRKTMNHAPANPTKSPGICKHLIKLFETLAEQNPKIMLPGTSF